MHTLHTYIAIVHRDNSRLEHPTSAALYSLGDSVTFRFL